MTELQQQEPMQAMTNDDLAYNVMRLDLAVKKLKSELDSRRLALKDRMEQLGVRSLQTNRYKVQIIPKKIVVIEDHQVAGEALESMNVPVQYTQTLTEQVQEVVKTLAKGDKKQHIKAIEIPGVVVKENTTLRIDAVEE